MYAASGVSTAWKWWNAQRTGAWHAASSTESARPCNASTVSSCWKILIKWTGSWGWATWRRAWKHFNPDGQALLDELERRRLTRTFDFDGAYRYTRMLRRQVEGKNNSWAIRWNASLFLADILSLNVGRSLVQNTGFDGSGTHCGGGGLYASTLWMKPLPVVRISPAVENPAARHAIARYYRRHFGFWAKAVRRIKRTLRGDFGA